MDDGESKEETLKNIAFEVTLHKIFKYHKSMTADHYSGYYIDDLSILEEINENIEMEWVTMDINPVSENDLGLYQYIGRLKFNKEMLWFNVNAGIEMKET